MTGSLYLRPSALGSRISASKTLEKCRYLDFSSGVPRWKILSSRYVFHEAEARLTRKPVPRARMKNARLNCYLFCTIEQGRFFPLLAAQGACCKATIYIMHPCAYKNPRILHIICNMRGNLISFVGITPSIHKTDYHRSIEQIYLPLV